MSTSYEKIQNLPGKVRQQCRALLRTHGIYSNIEMQAAGFRYTTEGDTVLCDTCNLRVSQWTHNMKPFAIHAQRSPNCEFVRSMQPLSNDEEKPPKRPNTNNSHGTSDLNGLVEAKTLKQVRERTFSHFPHRSSPSAAQMIEAGFFSCNVGDRVICLYCNLICQHWIPQTDDPWEIHSTLSPKCPYITARKVQSRSSGIPIVNDQGQATANRNESMRWGDVVSRAACHPNFIDIPRREASFATWSAENMPSVDALVRAGFFYTGTKTIVTCFYCNGSLQNWGAGDDPMVEHARWFPQCAYAKQLCGADLYRRIREASERQQEHKQCKGDNATAQSSLSHQRTGALRIPDESTLSRLVAARLDLNVSQRLLNRPFKLSIIKRCWEDQLRLKHEDFVSDCDLCIACIILQKQIVTIDGKKENIIVPSAAVKNDLNNASRAGHEAVEIAENTNGSVQIAESAQREAMSTSSPSNPCLMCLTEEKQLACIPCGHFISCVPCGHSLRRCAVCRAEITAFVRIYL